MLGVAGCDIDGVVCHDPTAPEDDEQRYLADIKGARPLWIPSRPVKHFVTHRLEHRRDITKEWLHAHGIVWSSLIMHPAKSCHERRAANNQDGTWKGHQAKALNVEWFIESCPNQARRIAEVSGKSVLCPATDTMFGES
jgi:uncharacterized HAD superfamily protein